MNATDKCRRHWEAEDDVLETFWKAAATISGVAQLSQSSGVCVSSCDGAVKGEAGAFDVIWKSRCDRCNRARLAPIESDRWIAATKSIGDRDETQRYGKDILHRGVGLSATVNLIRIRVYTQLLIIPPAHSNHPIVHGATQIRAARVAQISISF